MPLAHGQYTRTDGVPGGDRNYPRFFLHDEQDQLATEQQGRPIFKSEERVEIIMPGNPLTRPVQRVTEEHRQKWPEQYKAFKQGQEMSVEGTPLEQWPILKRAQVLELKALGHLTVEHIATMDDLAIQRIPMAGRRLKEMAIAYLDDAQAQALLSAKTAENERMTNEIDDLKRRVGELGRLLEDTHSQLQALRNAPNPIVSTAPMMLDPMEKARQAGSAEAPAESSLASLPQLRRPAARVQGKA